MQCFDCQSETSERASFCTACGARLTRGRTGGQALRTRPAPVLELAPRLHPRHALTAQVAPLLALWCWSTAFLGGATSVVARSTGLATSGLLVLLVVGALCAAAVPLLAHALDRRFYRHARLVFRPQRIEVHDGLLSQTERVLPLEEVVGVELERTPGQERLGLASVILNTHSVDRMLGHQLRLNDVPDAEDAVARIRTLLATTSEPERPRRAA